MLSNEVLVWVGTGSSYPVFCLSIISIISKELYDNICPSLCYHWLVPMNLVPRYYIGSYIFIQVHIPFYLGSKDFNYSKIHVHMHVSCNFSNKTYFSSPYTTWWSFFVKLFASRLRRRKLNYFTHAYIVFGQVSVNSDPDLVQKTSHRLHPRMTFLA